MLSTTKEERTFTLSSIPIYFREITCFDKNYCCWSPPTTVWVIDSLVSYLHLLHGERLEVFPLIDRKEQHQFIKLRPNCIFDRATSDPILEHISYKQTDLGRLILHQGNLYEWEIVLLEETIYNSSHYYEPEVKRKELQYTQLLYLVTKGVDFIENTLDPKLEEYKTIFIKSEDIAFFFSPTGNSDIDITKELVKRIIRNYSSQYTLPSFFFLESSELPIELAKACKTLYFSHCPFPTSYLDFNNYELVIREAVNELKSE